MRAIHKRFRGVEYYRIVQIIVVDTPLLWRSVLVAAVLVAIVALIAARPQPAAIDYLAGITIPF
jgi:hypothetical protein